MQRLEEHIELLEVDAAAHRRKRSSSDGEAQDGDSDEEVVMEAVAKYEEILRLLQQDVLELETRIEGRPIGEQRSALKGVVPSLVVSLSAHVGKHYWTSPTSRQLAKSLLAQLLNMCGCKSNLELLIGHLTSHDSHMTSPYAPIMTTEDPSILTSSTSSTSLSAPLPPNSTASAAEVPSGCGQASDDEGKREVGGEVEAEGGQGGGEGGGGGEGRGERVIVFNGGILKPVLAILRSKLTKETWKRHPTAKHALLWSLRQLRHPHVSPYLSSFLPPLLMLMDDHETYHKCLGLSAITHLIKNTDAAELRWYGRAEVIYEAIKNMLYIREVDVIHSLHLCLTHLLPVLEGPQPSTVVCPRKPTRCDEVFRIFLNSLDFESKILVRKAYVAHLSRYIELLGIYTARHMKQVLKVISGCLEFPDYSGEETRKYALQSLLTLMKHTWPRIPSHKDEILKLLLRLVSDVCPDSDHIPEKSEVRVQLTLVSECFVTLQFCCGGIEDTFKSLQSTCVHRGLLLCLETSLARMELEKQRQYTAT